eukprot:GGOE01044970.1.p1 GENE.GGOE01044970.1~~GGOE01044970.1.p1  ORF type:complete len:401 (-),score=67.17 GGOE01044970.1:43-1245(-)
MCLLHEGARAVTPLFGRATEQPTARPMLSPSWRMQRDSPSPPRSPTGECPMVGRPLTAHPDAPAAEGFCNRAMAEPPMATAEPVAMKKRTREEVATALPPDEGCTQRPKVLCTVADILGFKNVHAAATYYPRNFDFPSPGGCSQRSRAGHGVTRAASPHLPDAPVDLTTLHVCFPLVGDPSGLWVVVTEAEAEEGGEGGSEVQRFFVLDVNAAERQALTNKLSAAFDIQPQPLTEPIDLHTWCGDDQEERFTSGELAVLGMAQESEAIRQCLRMNGFHVTSQDEAGHRRFWLAGVSQTLGIVDYGPADLLRVCRAVAAHVQATAGHTAQAPERIPLQRCRSPRAMTFFAEQARRLVDRHGDQPRATADVRMVLHSLAAAEADKPIPLALLHTMQPRQLCD